ncbi:hypothetical protein BDY21DRAFT_372202 [Lineolata rhizophorae]|uniref:WD40-repeat-containing domain protein n=1 Tax=Lineolata rhizophorae TaxID=578093 RepID=A0A6A6NY61_9PEZI|nr:hypothetical protein BDY21DRAFT_372202 [Lineolata rhizophorae]
MCVEISDVFTSSQHTVPSPDGEFVAALGGGRLTVRSVASQELVRSIAVGAGAGSKATWLRWGPGAPRKLLVADDEGARVWDLGDTKWSATIDNGSAGMGRIVHADFGGSADEVLLASDFAAKLTVWSLRSGRSVEIRDPKFTTGRGFGYRPRSGIFSLLSRPGPHDVVTLHAPGTYKVMRTLALPTVDAQGLRWSPDGRWLAAWDTASAGCKVVVYTADGNLYRTYTGAGMGADDVPEGLGLGVCSVAWTPRADMLAVSGHDGRVALLGTRTFSPAAILAHAPAVRLPHGPVVVEQVTAARERRYEPATQPLTPPRAPEPTPPARVALLAFDAAGTALATRDDAAPTTLWLWDLARLAPLAVVVQHAPIRTLRWHPSRAGLFLLLCAHDEPVLYVGDTRRNDAPRILRLPLNGPAARLDACWVSTPLDRPPVCLVRGPAGHVLVWPDGREAADDDPNEVSAAFDDSFGSSWLGTT